MISLKWIKSWTNFCWPETSWYPNCIYDKQDLLTMVVDHLLNIFLKNFRGTVCLRHLYKKELDKACFAHDKAYSDSKDLAGRTVSDNIFKDVMKELMKLIEIINMMNNKRH